MALALKLHEQSLCPCGCGYTRGVAWDEGSEGWFDVDPQICYARAAREEYERSRGETRPAPGTLLLVSDVRE